ncbi:MAG: DEAD/DEAH box helicase family protein [Ignavibacteriaceae bacterium]
MNQLLQNIIDDISKDSLPVQWQSFELKRFSLNKSLFEFQEKSLENAVKALWLFFEKLNGDKKELYNQYKTNGLSENFDYDLTKREGKKTSKYLIEYENDYPVADNKISFEHFINRMSFWMATGSGKTLVIVKLIEILGRLIKEKQIPQKDILFLAHREDLLDQFKLHIDEYNSFNFTSRISLKNLKEYDQVKRESSLFANNEITVFYYKSDLFSDETKEKQINFRNYDNNGNWYILLDEAHKGDREESIRQVMFSILSRNGFLFNFSATFTDPRDYATCVFNFNLAKYVEEGYGKHIYVSAADISAFRDDDDFSDIDKQKIVLKNLILLTALHKSIKRIRKVNTSLYHFPMLLTLVNSVNTEDSDLQLFFIEIEKIASGKFNKRLFEDAKKEIIKEFNGEFRYLFEEELKATLDSGLINNLTYKDICEKIFYSKSPGKIEVLKIPGNRSELIFKLTTADSPFALIKIGDISNWLKEKLTGYEINESFDNESYFKKLNEDDSSINILMGSRTFYEGWDSNRPNIVLFINIGVGTDAKKFVLQSIGRGVRIEPIKNKRKRLLNLINSQEINFENHPSNKDLLPIESLYIFGTKAGNVKEIIITLKEEKDEIEIGDLFEINKEIEGKVLLIPQYKSTEKLYAEDNTVSKYDLSQEDYFLTKRYFEFISPRIAVSKYEVMVNSLVLLTESLNKPDEYFSFDHNGSYYQPEIHLNRLSKYFEIKTREFEKFKLLENEIVHFKRIRVSSKEKLYEIIEKIKRVKNYRVKNKVLEQLKIDFNAHKDLDKYTLAVQQTEDNYKKEEEISFNGKKIKIKYAHHHYYIPIVVSESEKLNYLTHIIKVPSEVRFLENLERYLQSDENKFKEYDWWMFSKLDESLDDIYIPYYNPKENSIARYKPDFIFWLQKGKEYKIIFADPKGTEFASYQHKVDGFKRVFARRLSDYQKLKVTVDLKLFTKDKGNVPVNYRNFWVDDIGNLLLPPH